jgi:cytosine/adenosine deaminase-related metal-dependent hydrolase
MTEITRRGAIAGVIAGCAATTLRAAEPDVLITNAHVLTMDERLGDLPRGDVRIRGDRIVEIGSGLPSDGAGVIDAAGAILLPGFVDTHWHMWNHIARNHAASVEGGFGPTMAALAPHWTPEDSGAGVTLALAEAVAAGITTAHNWAHNTRSPAHARAEYAAHVRAGVRGRFAYGYPAGAAAGTSMDLDDLSRMAKGPLDPLVSLGVCLRGPDRSDEPVWRREWAAARSLGLPITTHTSYDSASAAKRPIAALAEAGLLGPDTLMVHATHADDATLALLAKLRAPLSLSPWTELEVGYGVPPIARMAAAGVPISLSNDNVVLAGRIDMFAVMRLSLDLASGEASRQSPIDSRTALAWATIGGARAMGMAASIGSVTPRKLADLILVRPAGLHGFPAGPADRFLTHSAQVSDIEMVMIGGRIRKRSGQVDFDVPALIRDCEARMARLKRAAFANR